MNLSTTRAYDPTVGRWLMRRYFVPRYFSTLTLLKRKQLPEHTEAILLLDATSGTRVQSYDYEPYGAIARSNGSTPTEYQFAQLVNHPVSGLDLATTRAYDPATGRWLNRDPIGELGGINLYGYTSQNPANWTDPSGLCPPCIALWLGRAGYVAYRASQVSRLAIGGAEAAELAAATARARNALSVAKPPTTSGMGCAVGKVFSKPKQALLSMAKRDKKTGGITADDMQAYKDLNKELPDPFPENRVRGPERSPLRHPNSKPGTGQEWHGVVDTVNHIPIK